VGFSSSITLALLLLSISYSIRAKLCYLGLCTLGLTLFYGFINERYRTAGLSFIFPGAGLLAVGGVCGYVAFIISIAIFPLFMFAWFATGVWHFPSRTGFFPDSLLPTLLGLRL
jgi:hypothetical protein